MGDIVRLATERNETCGGLLRSAYEDDDIWACSMWTTVGRRVVELRRIRSGRWQFMIDIEESAPFREAWSKVYPTRSEARDAAWLALSELERTGKLTDY